MVIPQYLLEVLPVKIFEAAHGALWRCRPSEQFLRYVMPRTGWKVPGTEDAALVAVETTSNRWFLIAGQDVEPAARKIMAREPAASAVYESEQIALWHETEEKIAQGDFWGLTRLISSSGLRVRADDLLRTASWHSVPPALAMPKMQSIWRRRSWSENPSTFAPA